MVKVTLEFASVDQAIVALGKLAATPKVEVKLPPVVVKALTPEQDATFTDAQRKRKGRSDKGQARGPNAATTEKSDANAPAQATPGSPIGGVTDPAQSASASPAAAAAHGTTDGEKSSPSTTPQAGNFAGSTDGPTPQKLVEAVFNKHGAQIAMDMLSRFGVKRVRELKPEQHAEFVKYATTVETTGQV